MWYVSDVLFVWYRVHARDMEGEGVSLCLQGLSEMTTSGWMCAARQQFSLAFS